MDTWQILQEKVKTLSSYIWNCSATNETINGVQIDCVLKPKNDFWIIVEVTENQKLEKVREDIIKIATCKQYLLSRSIYVDGYIVMKENPTDSMITSGKGSNIKVQSFNTFSKQFIDYDTYTFIRNQKTFGSSVNPLSGEPDNNEYTPVFYENTKSKNKVSLSEIAKYLIDGKRIVLLGNYGTGKSRCIRELFNITAKRQLNRIIYPIAINLKENWGTQRADEIIRRHFGLLGLSHLSDSVIKILEKDIFIFLLDGFDEIGAQIWSDDPSKLRQIRSSSLAAVKDLILNTKSPIIITGREHYFNSNEEMFDSIGLKYSETEILRCKDEFTEDEMHSYLQKLSITIDVPIWLPKRPLICQIINSLEKGKIENIFVNSYSASEFWDTLIRSICDREAKISPILDSKNIFSILKEVSHLTRLKQGNVGPISISEINKSFEKVIGTPPVDESAVMLQRLPGLGRVSSETTDRQFIDFYILDGLRAENLIDSIYNNRLDVLEENWIQPIQKIGIEVFAKRIQIDKSANAVFEFLRKSLNSPNRIISGDILAGLVFYASKASFDLGGILIDKTSVSCVNFSKSLIENFLLRDSFINEIDISNYSFSRVTIKDCAINKIYGLKETDELPHFIINPIIDNFDAKPMDVGDKFQELKPSHMILVSLIKRTFFLSKASLKEIDFINNFGNKPDRQLASKISKILIREKILSKSSDDILHPKSYQRQRMIDLIQNLGNSNDKLWKEVANLC